MYQERQSYADVLANKNIMLYLSWDDNEASSTTLLQNFEIAHSWFDDDFVEHFASPHMMEDNINSMPACTAAAYDSHVRWTSNYPAVLTYAFHIDMSTSTITTDSSHTATMEQHTETSTTNTISVKFSVLAVGSGSEVDHSETRTYGSSMSNSYTDGTHTSITATTWNAPLHIHVGGGGLNAWLANQVIQSLGSGIMCPDGSAHLSLFTVRTTTVDSTGTFRAWSLVSATGGVRFGWAPTPNAALVSPPAASYFQANLAYGVEAWQSDALETSACGQFFAVGGGGTNIPTIPTKLHLRSILLSGPGLSSGMDRSKSTATYDSPGPTITVTGTDSSGDTTSTLALTAPASGVFTSAAGIIAYEYKAIDIDLV